VGSVESYVMQVLVQLDIDGCILVCHTVELCSHDNYGTLHRYHLGRSWCSWTLMAASWRAFHIHIAMHVMGSHRPRRLANCGWTSTAAS